MAIALGALPFEAHVIDRSTPFDVAEGVAFETCSAEDLVVLKSRPSPVASRTGWISKGSSFGRVHVSIACSCSRSCASYSS